MDEIGYQDDFYKLVSKELGGSETVKPEIVSLNRYFETPPQPRSILALTASPWSMQRCDIMDVKGISRQINWSKIFTDLSKAEI